MEQILFERPREKLQAKGAAFLSTPELLQVIIGSGSAKASGARLAKRVAKLIETRGLSFNALVAIGGIGTAKACQIAAAVELGSRVAAQQNTKEKTANKVERGVEIISSQRNKVALVYLLDGAQREKADVIYQFTKVAPQALVHKICTDAFAAGARTVEIIVGSKYGETKATTDDLVVLKLLSDTLNALHITLGSVYFANKNTVEKWRALS